MPKPTQPQAFNVPNVLTAARLLLAIVVFVLLAMDRELYIPAMIVFLVAASSDWVDGYWARKYGQVTQLGRIFDPFADKIIICGTFVFLAAEPGSGIYAWMAVVIIGREMLVTVLRSFLEQQGKDFSAKMPGKLKMVFQCVTVVASLLALHVGGDATWYGAAGEPAWLFYVLTASVWTAVVLTIYSGVGYIIAAARLMRASDA